MIAWLKVKKNTIMLVFSAILLALAGAKVAKRKGSAQKKEDKATAIMGSTIFKDQKKADKLIKSAEKDKAVAAKAKADLEKKLEQIGEQNADIDAIAHEFNSRRVRRK